MMLFVYDKKGAELCMLANGKTPLQPSWYLTIPEICAANNKTVKIKHLTTLNRFLIKTNLSTLQNFFYVISSPHICRDIIENGIVSLIHPDIVKRVRQRKCILILNSAHEHAYKLNMTGLEDILTREGIPHDLVIITGSSFCYKQKYHTTITQCFFNYFEAVMRLQYVQQPWLLTAHRKRIQNIQEDNITKRFVCLNRVPRDHRCLFVYKLWCNNLLPNTLCSLSKITDYNCVAGEPVQFSQPVFETPHNKTFLADNICKEKFKEFINELPLKADIKTEFVNWDSFDNTIVCDTGIYVITDTLFTLFNEAHLSFVNDFYNEKIFKPIAYKMPFITVSRPGTLRGLRQMGYMTFGSLWDESYDNIINPIDRMDAIINVLISLNKMPKADFNQLLAKAQDIANFNFLHLKRRHPEKVLLDALTLKEQLLRP